MLVCGIGCRRGTPAEDIEAAIQAVRTSLGCIGEIVVIATEATKSNEPGLREAARRLGVELVAFTSDELCSTAAAVLTHSPTALLHKGTPSVAEAAALLAGGPNARLLGPRIALPKATCAFAIGDGSAS